MANKSNEKENLRIGRLLQYARECQNLLQSDMVESTGLSKNHISAVERGNSKASIEMLLGYCTKLQTTPNTILGYSEDSIIPELKHLLLQMTSEEQHKLVEIIELIKKF